MSERYENFIKEKEQEYQKTKERNIILMGLYSKEYTDDMDDEHKLSEYILSDEEVKYMYYRMVPDKLTDDEYEKAWDLYQKTAKSNYCYEEKTTATRVLLNIVGVIFIIMAIIFMFYTPVSLFMLPLSFLFFGLSSNLKIAEINYNYLNMLDIEKNQDRAIKEFDNI